MSLNNNSGMAYELVFVGELYFLFSVSLNYEFDVENRKQHLIKTKFWQENPKNCRMRCFSWK